MTTLKNYFNSNLGTIIAFVLGALIFGAPLVRSWTEPTCAPPNCNAPAPLNVSDSGQQKTGPLTLTGQLTLEKPLTAVSGILANTGGAVKGLVVASGAVDFGGLLNFTNTAAAFRRITNLGAPIDGSDAATKSYVDAAAGSGGGYRCFISVSKFTGKIGGKSGADAKCGGEESGFSFGTIDQWYSRATAGVPINAFVYGGANSCSNWNSTSGSGDIITWDGTYSQWRASINACSAVNSLVCCNFNSSGVTAPSSLAGAPYREAKADLSWVDNSSNETGFRVYRGSTAGFTSADAGFPVTAAADSTTYRSDQPSGSLKYYRVTAYNAAGESNSSNEVSVTTPVGVIAASNLNWIRDTTNCCINGQNYYGGRLTWSDNSDIEADYRLMRCTTIFLTGCQSAVDYTQLGLPYGANSTSVTGEERYADDGLYYFYRIKGSAPGAPATDGWSGRILPAGGNGWMYAF